MFLKLISWLLVGLMGVFLVVPPVQAQASSDPVPTIESPLSEDQSVTLPDLNQFSLSDLPAFTGNGGFSEGTDQRSWQIGQTIDQVLTFSDLQDLAPGNLTLDQIGSVIGEDLGGLSIDEFPLLADQSVNDLMSAIPTLGGFDVESLAPISALVDSELGDAVRQGQTLFNAVQRLPELGELALGDIDLSDFAIDDIPGAAQAALEGFSGFDTATLDQVPGLDELPLSSFPNPAAAVGNLTMQIDMIWGPREGDRPRTISGSDQQGFAVPCNIDRQDCASIELQALGSGTDPLDGSHWVSGKYQEVQGGSGALGAVAGGMEPTGRHPFGPAFKQVIWEPEERDDTVTSAIFFRACSMAGCTPYIIGPFPFLTYNINDPIFVGVLEGDSPSETPSQRTGATRGGGMPGPGNTALGGGFNPNCVPVADAGVADADADDGDSDEDDADDSNSEDGDSEDDADDGDSDEDADTELSSSAGPDEIDVGQLAGAIATIESQGSGGYSAVGPHVCADGGRNCGRGLGKYQFMSYNAQAVQLISARPGGSDFLARVGNGHSPSSDELMQYFPPEDQDRAFEGFLRSNVETASNEIDPTTGQPFEGGRLIERAAQMHFGGQGSPIDGGASDSFGRLSLRDYGQQTREIYEQGGGGFGGLGSQACPPGFEVAGGSAGGGGGPAGKANGELIYPVEGQFPVTSEFGPRTPPCARCSANHAGIDLATPTGTPAVAADGGTVTYAGVNGSLTSGYGNLIIVDHGDGRETRYAHMDTFNVSVGQEVGQGEVIGTTGNTGSSTGPHLHFEVRENGAPQDPRNYINF